MPPTKKPERTKISEISHDFNGILCCILAAEAMIDRDRPDIAIDQKDMAEAMDRLEAKTRLLREAVNDKLNLKRS